MSIVMESDIVRLVGACPVEDAEPLLLALQDDPQRVVDVSAMEGAHFAVLQLLALFARRIEGDFADPLLQRLSFAAPQPPAL
ncbi:hypothetical protein [Novosphingobium sp.]|jgi:hypothetical protein|uniref:hypothetical protein n=1 Tax=Novosphingobium sp. TaxID=1874826 RepID=UPI003D6C8371